MIAVRGEDVPISEAQRKAVKKYNEKAYTEIKIRPKKEDAAQIKDHAKKRGESLNSFVIRACKHQIRTDNFPPLPTTQSAKNTGKE